jgi:hypothetical protein
MKENVLDGNSFKVFYESPPKETTLGKLSNLLAGLTKKVAVYAENGILLDFSKKLTVNRISPLSGILTLGPSFKKPISKLR